MAGVSALLVACASSPQSSPQACTPASATPVADVDLTEVAEDSSDVTFDLNNVSDSAVRVQVSVGGERALDVELPAGGACAHPPVYSYSFALASNRVDVEVTTSQDQHETLRLAVGSRHRWVVVMVQDGFPLTVDGHWKSAPEWG